MASKTERLKNRIEQLEDELEEIENELKEKQALLNKLLEELENINLSCGRSFDGQPLTNEQRALIEGRGVTVGPLTDLP